MDVLKIKATEDTPRIVFNPEKNTLTIEGNSFPEDTFIFYTPVFSWLGKYLEVLSDEVQFKVNIYIMYYNSSSSKILMNLFRLLDETVARGKNIVVNWFYDEDDEDSMEEGEDFKTGIELLTFNIVQKGE